MHSKKYLKPKDLFFIEPMIRKYQNKIHIYNKHNLVTDSRVLLCFFIYFANSLKIEKGGIVIKFNCEAVPKQSKIPKKVDDIYLHLYNAHMHQLKMVS